MMRQGRAPAVEHGGETDPGAEVLGVGDDRDQRLGRSLEQEIVESRQGIGGNSAPRTTTSILIDFQRLTEREATLESALGRC
jgi:hypothetical protein